MTVKALSAASMSSAEMDPTELEHLLQEKLSEGEHLLDRLKQGGLQAVAGVPKLEKKIRQEIRFLKKFLCREQQQRDRLKSEHLQCSNLQHLSAIVDALSSCSDPQGVLQSFSWCEGQEGVEACQGKKITVDVVSEGGLVWTKVVARNPRALDLNSCGGNQFGQRSIMDQVRDFLACARHNTRMFRVPRVAFVFHNGVSDGLAKKLVSKGLEVRGQIVPSLNSHLLLDSSEEESGSDDDEQEEVGEEVAEDAAGDGQEEVEALPLSSSRSYPEFDSSTLNLDITAMIAYVSALTNGFCSYSFKEPILSEQARWERERPVKPTLEALFAGKRLLCCKSAMRDFRSILGTLGGEGERARAEELCSRVEVVADRLSPRLAHLDLSGKIKERSRAIFGTGDCLKVVTVTANSGFVRAASGQGVELAVVLHESRALTEDKMKGGMMVTKLDDDGEGEEGVQEAVGEGEVRED